MNTISSPTPSHTPLLDKIASPEDLRTLTDEQLKELANEVRQDTIRTVSITGGHLGASLGVVELSVALHATFDTPRDQLIWDVGHQTYPHKILTGRRHLMHTLRQGGGLSGFTKRDESPYDPFGAAHSSTSISAALGMAVARSLHLASVSPPPRTIAVIGDGAMSAGMAYEAMNNAGAMSERLIVILNDNDMSIAPPVGALSAYLSRLISSKPYRSMRHFAGSVAKRISERLENVTKRAEEYARGMITGGTLFEELGFYYIGPVDGHNLDHLLPVLRNLRKDTSEGPVLLHVVTQKGYGYFPAEQSSDKYHGVGKFDIASGKQEKKTSNAPSWTKIFADALVKVAADDAAIVAVTAAMPSGTGLDSFATEYPTRCFDVGMAEQHAVTFAAGLATQEIKPFVAIYSTFLQRAYDQIIHDIAIQNLPVRFAIDRAGYVGADGATHCGAFDLAYLGCLPNFVIMAPADACDLERMVVTAAAYEDGPIAFRYPRGEAHFIGSLPDDGDTDTPSIGKERSLHIGKEQSLHIGKERSLHIGKGRLLRVGASSPDKGRVALLTIGTCLHDALSAATELDKEGYGTTVADARFLKPLDTALLHDLATTHDALVIVEEGSIGGFAAHVTDYLLAHGLLDGALRVRSLKMPDVFIDHNTQDTQRAKAGLDSATIIRTVRAMI